VVVNLAPADVKKKNSHLELSVAVALLGMMGLVKRDLTQTLFLGELALDGKLRPIKSALVLVLAAKKLGFKRVILPESNRLEVKFVNQVEIYLVKDFKEIVSWVKGEDVIEVLKIDTFDNLENSVDGYPVVLEDIKGQWLAKRALEITAAGGHNLLLLGPPGSGKTMMAQALASILPPLSKTEALEVAELYSLKGVLNNSTLRRRPFRNPHHSISQVGLLGGGVNLMPGELVLAHRGVLFLDEFAEFSRDCIEAMRQPLESGFVNISRASGQVRYPAQVCLVAAANPCPCGFNGSLLKKCKCSPFAVSRYRQKLSGPIMDRIDLQLRVNPVKSTELAENLKVKTKKVTSTEIRARVCQARKVQRKRLVELGLHTNSQLTSKQVREHCSLSDTSQRLLLEATDKFKLSARSYYKVITVAQTIADLAGHKQIEKSDLGEALTYRF
jgi:magnesium chelatase family protein